MQAGFQLGHRLEDLVIPADVALDQSSKSHSTLAIAFVDLRKAFDSVPRHLLLSVRLELYSIDPSIVESIRRMY